MELLEAQTLDLELLDLETRMAEEWHQSLYSLNNRAADDEDLFDESDTLSAFIRS